MKKSRMSYLFQRKWNDLNFRSLKFVFLISLFLLKGFLVNSYSQTTLLSLNLKNVPVNQFIQEIEKQTGYYFLYQDKAFREGLMVSIKAENEPLQSIMEHFDKQASVMSEITEQQIILKEKPEEEVVQAPQQKIITGMVVDKDGKPLAGVTVVVKGTTTGTLTTNEGKFSLTIPADAITLQFSFVGMKIQEIEVAGKTIFTVVMEENAIGLDEVIVTAISITRQKRELGYSAQQVSNAEMVQKSNTDVVNTLQGKVAGVEIITGNGLPGSNTQMFIRGLTSALGNNQPLMVIDGVPMDNSTTFTNKGLQTAGTAAGTTSNRSLDLNPSDIESISVLKGPSAATLYGSRASNGVVMITTKKGNFNEKMSIQFTSSLNFQSPSTLPKYQNSYGQGSNYEFNDANQHASWGPRFGNPDYSTVKDFRGVTVPYQAYPNNIKDFFQTGRIIDNSISVSGGDATSRYILSGSNTDQTGILSNSYMKRTTVRSAGSAKLKNGISVEGSFTYSNTQVQGPQLGNSGTSPFFILMGLARSYDLMGMPYKDVNGTQIFYSPSRDNPRWACNESPTTSDVNRLIASAKLDYEPFKGLNFTYRAGIDQYIDQRREVVGYGSHPLNNSFALTTAGGEIYDDLKYREINHDFFGVYTRELIKDFKLRVLVGAGANQRKNDRLTSRAEAFIVPNYFNLANHNTANISSSNSIYEKRLVALYSQLGFSYKTFAYLELQGRNDWSSTLPKNNNSYFYSSANLSFVFSELFKIQESFLNFGKFRLSAAKVGSDTDPYQISNVYAVPTYGNSRLTGAVTFPFNNTVSYVLNSRLGNSSLKPQFTSSYEAGLELGLLKSRIHFDLTYYNTKTSNQILPLSISGATGYTTVITNAGEIGSNGVEIMADGRIITNDSGFSWDISLNFSKMENKVISLPEGVTTIILPGSQTAFPSVLIPGKPYGAFPGSLPVKDSKGRYVVNPATMGGFGIPNQIIGDPNPDWTSSLTNTFSYKGFSFEALLSFIKGGDLLSANLQTPRGRGVFIEQADNREVPWMYANAVWGNPDGTPTENPVNVQMTAQDYWGNSLRPLIFDATTLRLREVSLKYSLPKDLLKKTPFGSGSISFSGRNLWHYSPNIKHIDPEVNTGGGNTRGIDYASGLGVKNYGINISLTF